VVVYGDMLFALNALVDYVLLYVAGRAAHARVDHRRLVLAALGGGLYAVGQPLGWLPFAYGPVGVLACSLALLAVAYAPVPVRQALRLVAYLYGAALALAGAVLAVGFARAEVAAGGPGLPWWAVAVPVAAAAAVARWAWPLARARWAAAPQPLVRVAVGVGGAEADFWALVDTGNRLRDPLGQGPVLVVEARAVAPLLPVALTDCLGAPQPVWEEIARRLEGSPWAARLRLIPYRSLGTGGGMLIGFRPDRASVDGRAIAPPPPTLGLSPVPLDPEGRFQGLCPAVLLAEVPPAVGARAS
jgi:stage II sporulation protein GA (sporulation sigma-E factor processing peptidase)